MGPGVSTGLEQAVDHFMRQVGVRHEDDSAPHFLQPIIESLDVLVRGADCALDGQFFGNRSIDVEVG